MCISSVSFFSTRPTREHIRSLKGGSGKGLSILPKVTSFCSLFLIIWGSSLAVGRFSGALNLYCQQYSSAKPLSKSWNMYQTFSLSGWYCRSSWSHCTRGELRGCMFPLVVDVPFEAVISPCWNCYCWYCCCCCLLWGQKCVVCTGEPHLPHMCGKEHEGWVQPPLLWSKQFLYWLSGLHCCVCFGASCFLKVYSCGVPWWGMVWILCRDSDYSCWSIWSQGILWDALQISSKLFVICINLIKIRICLTNYSSSLNTGAITCSVPGIICNKFPWTCKKPFSKLHNHQAYF